MNFWRAVEILNKRKWLIVLSVLVATALTYGVARLTGSRWVATVRFVTEVSSPLASGVNNSDATASGGEAGRQATRLQALAFTAFAKSPNVLGSAIEKINTNSEDKSSEDKNSEDKNREDKISKNKNSEYKITDDMIPALLNNIEIEALGGRLFQLQITDNDPGRAQVLANTLATSFVEGYKNQHTEGAVEVVGLLKKQLKRAEDSLSQARRQQDAYKNQHRIANNLNNNLELALGRLREARQRQDEVQGKLAEAEARLQKMESSPEEIVTYPGRAVPSLEPSVNPMIAQIEADLKDAEQKVRDMQERYTDSSPKLKEAIENRDAIKERLEQEKSATPASVATGAGMPTIAVVDPRQQLRQEIAGCKAQLRVLEKNIASASAELDKYKVSDSPLTALAAKVAERNEERANVAARLNRAQIELDVATKQTPIATINEVGEFNPVINTTAGRTTKLLLLAALGALVCACAVIVALDSIDRRLRTVSQAEIVLPARVVAAIPQPMGPVSYSTLARVTEKQPMSLHAEAYRFLASHLLRLRDPGVKALMVLSAKAEQGSTTAISNLGISLAQAGKRVILVDANIRTAELHQVFDLPNDRGFINLLQTPDTTLDEVLCTTDTPNLQVIPSGPTPENPWSLFRSPNLAAIAHQLRERADYVIYDTPSALMFTDALNIASVAADAAFLCVRALEPLTGGEERIVELLKEANVPVLGSVLNDVPASVIEGYDNYQHYYAAVANQSVVTLASSPTQGAEWDKAGALIEIPKGPEQRNNRDA